MTAPLLTTKLCVPPVRPGLVPRPRLIERLNTGAAQKLTLISAPAGFGKTTLISAWLRGIDRPCVWLSLDEGDNDPARFLAYLLAALQQIDPGIGRSAQAMLQSPQPPPPEAALTTLINDIAATSQSFIAVIDDYHVIHSLPIHQQLAFLLEHQPPNMHVILATREDPPLPLSRMRARGQIVEVRHADLKFTERETAEFLQGTMGLELSAASLAALYRRTEGWISGLQLVALSLQRSGDVESSVQSFTSCHRYVLDYLIEEVFQQQTTDVQDFLQSTSVLERFTASLCDAVTERNDSHEVLLALEHANLFLVPLDESRQWHRYHRLFVDLLRHRLQISSQDRVPLLHERASQWYEDAGYPADAVHHALAGCDWERSAALILAASETMLERGELATLLRWYLALPDSEVRARPRLCLDYSWALILTGQLDAAESYLSQAEGAARDIPDFHGAILAAQAQIARTRGDTRRAIDVSERALSTLPEADFSTRSVVGVNLGIAYWNSGHLRQAEQALAEANRAARRVGNHYARLVALGFLGAIRATWGRLHQASELYEQTIRSGKGLPPVALAHNHLGALLYEWNDLEAAAEHLQQGLDLSQRSGNVEILGSSYRTLARVRQAQGDDAAALNALERAHQLARDGGLDAHQCARNVACHVQIALAQGDVPTAIRWAEQVTEDADASPFCPLLGLTQPRLSIARGRKASAAERLDACSETAEREGWQYGLVVVRALQCLAAPTADEALAFLSEALALAEPEGYLRTFVDLGEPMAALLRRAVSRGIAPGYAQKLLTAFGDTAAAERPQIPAAALALAEPLSDRELDALYLLAEGQTNREIARALFVSINTVKTHLKNIYSKLGVNNRRQASARARKLGLLG